MLRARTCRVLVAGWAGEAGTSAIIVANHCCLLDSAVAIHASARLGYDWRILASPRIVARYGWAYGDRYISVGEDALSVTRGLRGAAGLVRSSPPRLLWTYPQGDHVLPGEPLAFRRGTATLARMAPEVPVVCAGIRYEMFRRDRPVCAVVFVRLEHGQRDLASMAEGTSRAIEGARELIAAAAPGIPKRF